MDLMKVMRYVYGHEIRINSLLPYICMFDGELALKSQKRSSPVTKELELWIVHPQTEDMWGMSSGFPVGD